MPATEPHDIALLQEIRTWLRSLPETERLSRAQKLAADGDKIALRALLTAPAYLTGVDENLLALVRDEAARKADPRRYAKLEAMRKASTAADRAVEGVIRYIEQSPATHLPRSVPLESCLKQFRSYCVPKDHANGRGSIAVILILSFAL